ncbi:unnamed protein product [Allacma fusca]|uniref:DNA-directed RNA polymerase I subunit RPA49 n=1 Tax=Allacma fusca TaxID=39272 RepID=A0A8J2JRT3_9HEXA|nr:unnamed protein product [Allacma fusca]
MGKVRVKQVWDKSPNSLGPIQIQFEHAEISTEATGKDLSKYFTGHVLKNIRNSTSDLGRLSGQNNSKKVVVLDSDLMSYVGHADNPSKMSGGGSTTKTYIAIQRKNKMELFEVTPITVSPVVAASFVEDNEKDVVRQSLKERRDAEASLVKVFGSKKKRITFENREKNEVTNMNESIQAAAFDVKMTETPPEIKDDFFLHLIPPCNREAKEVSDIYKISDMITDEELELLEPLALQCLHSTPKDVKCWQDSKTFSDYFYTSLKWLKVRKDEARNVLSMELVLYTEILIWFYKIAYKNIRGSKLPKYPTEFPVELVKKVYNDFTFENAVGVRTRPEELKDKCCCYIMTLVLLAGDYIFDVQLMSTIFQIHIKKLILLARAVGITVNYVTASKEYKAVLKLPLPAILERRGRGKRKF